MKHKKDMVINTNLLHFDSNEVEVIMFYKKKEITIHLEFPKQQKEEILEDVKNRLKELYLRKMK